MVFIPMHVTDLTFGFICFFVFFENGVQAVDAVVRLLAEYFGASVENGHLNPYAATWMNLIVVLCWNAAFLWIVMGGLRSQEAVENLRNFRLADAQCQSEEDREALLAVIGDFFSDTYSGETDQDRLRKVGWHRFESFAYSRDRGV